jgi:hypothetical protein
VIASSGFIAESFGTSVRDAQLIATSLGVIVFVAQVLAYVSRAEGQGKGVPAPANKQAMLTRRNYWKFAIASATLLAIANIARRVERIGTRRAIDLSLMVHAQAARAIRDLIEKKQTGEDLQHLKSVADASVRVFWGQDKPPGVVAAAVTAQAALLASQIPPVPSHWVAHVTMDLKGNVQVALIASQDILLADVRILSSVPNRKFLGIVVEDRPRVIAYKVTIDGLTQAIDGIFWVDSVFTRCTIRFNGGEVNLSQVHFENCDFDSSLDANPILKRILLRARDNTITFSSAMATDRS